MILLLLMLSLPIHDILFDFTIDADLSRWRVVDDVVMGGRSNGNFKIDNQGNGLYSGEVSLENNGGFSSLRYNPEPREIKQYDTVILRVRGDGKRYQLRMKTSDYDRHSYAREFQTSGEWETIKVDLRSMKPTFRGRSLNMPDYPAEQLGELAILIGNKKPESFELEIDWIGLE